MDILNNFILLLIIKMNNRSPNFGLLRQSILCYVQCKSNLRFYLSSRQLFNFPNFPKLPNILSAPKKLEWKEKKIVGFTLNQMYDIVHEVEKYPEFVPWCKKCVITRTTPNYLLVDMTVGFGPVTESYESRLTLRPDLIKVESTTGKLLSYMETTWKFQPGLPRNTKSCTMEFIVGFEFKSKLHSNLAETYFDEVVKSMSAAFVKRAEAIYGRPSMATIFIK
ncbi:Coenzyme Q-binding protein coq10a, mitochondrial [Chamberlinius hualienensis]